MQKLYSIAFTALSVGFGGAAMAQADYPSKPIRLVVPYAAGGGTDVQARKVASYLSDVLKQSVVVDNKPGAGTTIGAADVAKAAPDGYTLLWGDNATFAVNPHLYKKLSYDVAKSFAPISVTVKGGLVLSVNPSIPATNVSELIAYAKANPGKMSYGTPGNGTPHHLIMEAFKKAAGGLDIVHAPYKGEGPAMTDLAGGTLQTMFSGGKVAVAMSQANRIRTLAFSGPERNKAAPTVPTFAEAGFPGFVNEYWHGVVAPAGTPQAVITKLNAAFKQVLANPELGQWLTSNTGTRGSASTPNEMAQLMAEDFKRSGELIKSLNIELN
jgi:tripartite-type tricarboxylate transporter receptor subunit TctC